MAWFSSKNELLNPTLTVAVVILSLVSRRMMASMFKRGGSVSKSTSITSSQFIKITKMASMPMYFCIVLKFKIIGHCWNQSKNGGSHRFICSSILISSKIDGGCISSVV